MLDLESVDYIRWNLRKKGNQERNEQLFCTKCFEVFKISDFHTSFECSLITAKGL